jgi:uncharacterized FAD-dependent dehydrogenase
MNIFDVAIIGLGVGGAFAALRLSKEHKSLKIIGFDIGRPPQKRRRQMEGWLGCFPNSDGKLYINDLKILSNIVDGRRLKSANKYFHNILSNVGEFKIIEDNPLYISLEKKIKKIGYDIELNNYIQTYPKDIHALSKYISNEIEKNKNVQLFFDNEVLNVYKQKNIFIIQSANGEYRAKKLIVAVGRSGWRWAGNLYKSFGIIDSNNVARFGIRVEINSSYMKDFNKSNCKLYKDNIEIGPLSWNGTVIPEDHLDLTISSFRSNENRWKSDRVSFNLIGNINFPNEGYEQTDRLGKLTFVLSNDRIIKEKISLLMNNKSKISVIKEYNWIKNAITEISKFLPEILTKASFHVPTIVPAPPSINLGTNLESEIEGMFVIGESAGVNGILGAGVMGAIVSESVCK